MNITTSISAAEFKRLTAKKPTTGTTPATPRKPLATPEFDEQCALFKWARNPAVLRKHPELSLLSASLNGVRLSKAQAGKAWAAGMLKGEWDVRLPVARGGFVGLVIEMKAGKNRLTKEQREYQERMQAEGHKCVACWSWTDAMNAIVEYLFFQRTTELRGGWDVEKS